MRATPIGTTTTVNFSDYTQIPSTTTWSTYVKTTGNYLYGFPNGASLVSSTSYITLSPMELEPGASYTFTKTFRFLCTLNTNRAIVRQSYQLSNLNQITLASNEKYLVFCASQNNLTFEMTLTARTAETCTVSFDTTTTSKVDSFEVIKGTSVGELPTIKNKLNSEFLGWTLNGEYVTADTTIDEDCTLTAAWLNTEDPTDDGDDSTYEMQEWNDDETLVDAEHMNHIERGIYNTAKSLVKVNETLDSYADYIESTISAQIEDLMPDTSSIINSDEFEAKVDELVAEMDLDYDAIAKSGWQGKKVAWIGDSLTQGGAWCSIVNKVFNFNATNVGVGGTTVSYEGASSMCNMERLTGDYSNVTDPNTGLVTANGKVTPTDLDVLFFQGATNDWARNHPIGERMPKFGKKVTNMASASEGTVGAFSSLDDDLNIVVTEDSTKTCFKITTTSAHNYYLSNGAMFNVWDFDASGTQLATGTDASYTPADNSAFIVVEVSIYSFSSYTEDTFVSGFLNGGNISSNTNYKTSRYIPVKPGITITSTVSLRFVDYFKQGKYKSVLTNVTSFTVPDGIDSMRFTCTTSTSPVLTFSEVVSSGDFTVDQKATTDTYLGDKTYVYDSCYWLFDNLINYETKKTFQVIALGTGYGQMKNRSIFGENTFGVLNKLNLSTIEYGDVLVDAAGMYGWKGINIGREMGINYMNNGEYIPDGLHFGTAASQKRAAEVIINFLLAHEPRNENL